MLKGIILAALLGAVIDVPVQAHETAPSSTSQSAIAQVEQISQFSDVYSSHWAFEALQNIVEDYGCLEGYPDRTYRGEEALTRYEFAAGLNSCLQEFQRSEVEAVEPVEERSVIIPVDEPDFEPSANLSEVFNRAFFNDSGDYYEAITLGSQLNFFFGFESFPEGSYPENEIADDAQLLNILLQDALAQQVQSAPPIRTPDLENPFDRSLFQLESYPSFDIEIE